VRIFPNCLRLAVLMTAAVKIADVCNVAPYYFPLNMEVARFSETSVNIYQSTGRHITGERMLLFLNTYFVLVFLLPYLFLILFFLSFSFPCIFLPSFFIYLFISLICAYMHQVLLKMRLVCEPRPSDYKDLFING
jgi:hypothetical protein